MTGSAREMWIKAMKEELDSLVERDVKVDVTNQDIQRMYWSHGTRTKTVPARLLPIKKPLHDGKGGWTAKARVVVCGNFEPGSIAKRISRIEQRCRAPLR